MPLLNVMFRHLVSFTSLAWVLLNLTAWFLVLLPLVLVKLLLPVTSPVITPLVRRIYIAAAALDSFWMKDVIGVNITTTGEFPDHPAPVVIANHQTWFDIPVIQDLICGDHGLIVKFLIKRELVRVPIIGWICLALDFPRLYRGTHDTGRQRDFQAIRLASDALGREPGALLIFPEGTRFTAAKHRDQASPYTGLLRPKTGGLKILADVIAPETPLVDLTIRYEPAGVNFWQCLNGSVDRIDVSLRHTRFGDVTDVGDWLDATWRTKSANLS